MPRRTSEIQVCLLSCDWGGITSCVNTFSAIQLNLSGYETQKQAKPNYKFPCVGCMKPVRSNQRGIECSRCLKWTHLKCSASTAIDYASLDGQEWFCSSCISTELPFYDSDIDYLNTGTGTSDQGGSHSLSLRVSHNNNPHSHPMDMLSVILMSSL